MVKYLAWTKVKKVQCETCGEVSALTSEALGLCRECIRKNSAETRSFVVKVHTKTKGRFGLPGEPPRNPTGVKCDICAELISVLFQHLK